MKLICAVFLFMGMTVSAAPATPSDPAPQILRCWDNKDQNGGDPGFVLEQNYAPFLSSPEYNFDNKISSCCGVGTWILYDSVTYNIQPSPKETMESFLITSEVSGSEFCTDIEDRMDNRTSSIRFAGLPTGDQFDAIRFYSNDHYSGFEEPPSKYYSALQYEPRSIIVHGCDQWTLYSEENFQGNKTCTDRKPDMIADCRPYFYEDSVKVNAKFGTIKSAMKGCVL